MIFDLEDSRDKDYVPDSCSDSSCSSDSTFPMLKLTQSTELLRGRGRQESLSPLPQPIDSSDATCVQVSNTCSNDLTDFIPVGLEITPTKQISTLSDKPSTSLPKTHTKIDKKHYCVFCGRPQAKLKRHLLSCHSKEPDMIPFLTSTGKKNKDELSKLRNAGDHLYNLEVLKGTGEKMLVVKRSLKKETTSEDYIPCPNCVGYFYKRDLWRHKCPSRIPEIDIGKRQQVKHGKLFLPHDDNTADLQEIWVSMRADAISIVAKQDDLITLLCKREYIKNGFDKDRHAHIRNKLREMARLLIELRKRSGSDSARLKDFITPQHFENVIAATRNVAGYTGNSHDYGKPSLALKIGHSIHKCCTLLRAQAIERKDTNTRVACESFEELYKIKWEEEISSQASRTLYQNKKNCGKELPLLEDIKKLTTYLNEEGAKIRDDLNSEDESIIDDIKSSFSRLSELTLCHIMLFNRRRQGEVSKFKLSEYVKGMENLGHSEDVLSRLSKVEQTLCKIFTRIEITGKRGRTVPVLLTSNMKSSLDLLMKIRDRAGVNPNNPFIFARIGCNSLDHIRGSDCLREIVQSTGIDLKKPDLLKSTALRKQLATMTQLVNLKDNELDIVAQYLGHDVRVHREYYRLPTGTAQIAKVSKLLLAMSEGNPEDPCNEDASNSDSNDDQDDMANPQETAIPETTMSASSSPHVIEKRRSKTNKEQETTMSASSSPHVIEKRRSKTNKEQVHRDMSKRQYWSDQEREACLRSFQRNITLRSLPGKAEILQAMEKEPILLHRSWIQIKNFIRNYINKLT